MNQYIGAGVELAGPGRVQIVFRHFGPDDPLSVYGRTNLLPRCRRRVKGQPTGLVGGQVMKVNFASAEGIAGGESSWIIAVVDPDDLGAIWRTRPVILKILGSVEGGGLPSFLIDEENLGVLNRTDDSVGERAEAITIERQTEKVGRLTCFEVSPIKSVVAVYPKYVFLIDESMNDTKVHLFFVLDVVEEGPLKTEVEVKNLNSAFRDFVEVERKEVAPARRHDKARRSP